MPVFAADMQASPSYHRCLPGAEGATARCSSGSTRSSNTLTLGYGLITRTKGRNTPDDRAERGCIHTGPPGSGHFVKRVHNGIEYGLREAYVEGFDILKNCASDRLPAEQRFDLNLADIAKAWLRGSVVGDVNLNNYTGAVADSGEGRWTINAAIEQGMPTTVVACVLYARFRSNQDNTYGDRLLSAMRFGFGGHVEIPQ